MSERSGGRERSEQSGASERVSGANERANGRASGPVAVLNESIPESFGPPYLGFFDAFGDVVVVDGTQSLRHPRRVQPRLEHGHFIDGNQQRFRVDVDVVSPTVEILVICQIGIRKK